MNQKQELEGLVLEELLEIEKYGFTKPVVNRQNWSTTIDWFHDNIALEIELDRRDLDLFVLIVRLEEGKLPAGYYVSNGKPCRLHLQKVIKKRGWSVDQDVLAKISTEVSSNKQSYSVVEIKERLENYRKVLMSCIQQIVIERDLIFQS